MPRRSALFARQAVDSVTVDDVVKEAGLAKGTFYVHFTDLRSLTTEVADTLLVPASDARSRRIDGADRSRRAHRLRLLLDRQGAGRSGMGEGAGALDRNVRQQPRDRPAGVTACSRISANCRGDCPAVFRPISSLEIIAGILLATGGCDRGLTLSWRDRDPSIAAILRALGADARQVKTALASLPAPQEGGVRARSRRGGPQSKIRNRP